MTRSAIARAADEALERRAGEGASCAHLSVGELTVPWKLTDAELLREAADAVEQGEIVVAAIEIEKAAD